MVHQNDKILKIIKPMFPVRAIIKGLQSTVLDKSVKAVLTRIFLSIFMNTEKIMYVKRPKMQRVLGENHYPCSWLPNFISIEELEQLKKFISYYFDENTVV